jgi:hypothetical protein
MSFSKATVLTALMVVAPLFAAPAMAADLVTYTWTTTSEGFGPIVGEPSSASFQVSLAYVQAGSFSVSDITDIQLAYPGLSLTSFAPSGDGLDNDAFVNPTTGAFIFHDADQGLGVVGFAGPDINDETQLLSITIDNPYSPFGVLLNHVADQFNALDNGIPVAGFQTAGFWTASFPVISAVPEPSTWAMFLLGFGGIGFVLRKSRRKDAVATA